MEIVAMCSHSHFGRDSKMNMKRKRKLVLNPKTPNRNRRLQLAAQMPRLNHWPDHLSTFDIMKSEAAQWLVDQPEIREWVFRWFYDHGAIEFVEDGVWQGAIQRLKPNETSRPS